MKFYRFMGDVRLPNRWFLKGPYDSNGNWLNREPFMSGIRLKQSETLFYRLRRDGNPLKITFADFDIPLVSEDVGAALQNAIPDAVQLIPLEMLDKVPLTFGIQLLNITAVSKCLDEVKSEITWWKEEDGRPDKIGQYRMITRLVLDGSRLMGCDMFRIDGWKVAAIVSNRIKEVLEKHDAHGAMFEELEIS